MDFDGSVPHAILACARLVFSIKFLMLWITSNLNGFMMAIPISITVSRIRKLNHCISICCRINDSFTYYRSSVHCWGKNGPDSRLKLVGLFPGAQVTGGPNWPYGREVRLVKATYFNIKKKKLPFE